jgi:glycine hydroxymethyltransferase
LNNSKFVEFIVGLMKDLKVRVPDSRSGRVIRESALSETDPTIHFAIADEFRRLSDGVELIASENMVSSAVLEAQGSVMTNKYAEGYPGRRYYGGCEQVDIVERTAVERAKRLFGCSFANVQPHSGSQANQAVMMALLEPGDTVMGMSLASGGHLTHGARPNQSGKWFNAVQYGVREIDGRIDYEGLDKLARECGPKLIIGGGSAYPRIIDFARLREIADSVDAILMIDMAHFAGLVAAKVHPDPFPHAHVVTTTTHKTLRGPRGGMVLCNGDQLAKKIDSAVFPGLQGGPLMHVIAAKAVALGEALEPSFKSYSEAVVHNAQVLGATLRDRGLELITDGTDTHLILVDLRAKLLTGNVVEKSLERAGITCNKNAVPFDSEKPSVTSGIRLGTPAGTTRGFGEDEFKEIGELIGDVLDGLFTTRHHEDERFKVEKIVKGKILSLCKRFPIYSDTYSM